MRAFFIIADVDNGLGQILRERRVGVAYELGLPEQYPLLRNQSVLSVGMGRNVSGAPRADSANASRPRKDSRCQLDKIACCALRRAAWWFANRRYPRFVVGLQAVDYFLWALQRFYERGEERYVQLIWPQTTMVCDLDAEPLEPACKGDTKCGVTYNETRPLSLATRAGVVKRVVEDIG